MCAHFESLEKRTLFTTYPLPDLGIDSTSGIWSVDASGNNLQRLLPAGTPISKAVEYGGLVYFEAGYRLYSTDGTAAGTKKIAGDPSKDAWRANLIGIVNNQLYYTDTRYDSNAHEAYGYMHVIGGKGAGDLSTKYASIGGTIRGGKLYMTVTRYAPYSYHVFSVSVNNKLTEIGYADIPLEQPQDTWQVHEDVTIGSSHIYAADDPAHGKELWVDNGTGAHLAQDIFSGAGSSSPTQMAVTHGRVIFNASAAVIKINSATISGGTLFVGTSDDSDQINISSSNGITKVVFNLPTYTLEQSFNESDFSQIQVKGFKGNDLIDLSDATKPATIWGDEGTDTVVGGDSDDVIDLGADNIKPLPSWLSLSNSVVAITATSADDTILVSRLLNDPTNLSLSLNGEVVARLFGDINEFLIYGGDGNDLIRFVEEGGKITQKTRLYGQSGSDTLYGAFAADRIYGGAGNDWIDAGGGNDIIYGEDGNDRLFGGDGNDYLNTGAGSDIIRSGNGKDRIFAKIGSDDLRDNRGDLVAQLVS